MREAKVAAITVAIVISVLMILIWMQVSGLTKEASTGCVIIVNQRGSAYDVMSNAGRVETMLFTTKSAPLEGTLLNTEKWNLHYERGMGEDLTFKYADPCHFEVK